MLSSLTRDTQTPPDGVIHCGMQIIGVGALLWFLSYLLTCLGCWKITAIKENTIRYISSLKTIPFLCSFFFLSGGGDWNSHNCCVYENAAVGNCWLYMAVPWQSKSETQGLLAETFIFLGIRNWLRLSCPGVALCYNMRTITVNFIREGFMQPRARTEKIRK